MEAESLRSEGMGWLEAADRANKMGFYVTTVGQGKSLRFEVNCKKCCIPVVFDIKERDDAYNIVFDGKAYCQKFRKYGFHQMAFTDSSKRDYKE